MLPLTSVAHGFLLVLFDFRINGFDLLIDLPGWLFLIYGLGKLVDSVDRQFGNARTWAMVGAAISVVDLVGAIGLAVLGIPYAIVTVVVCWLVATALMRRARTFGDEATAKTFDLLRWVLPGAQFVALLVALSGSVGLFLLVVLAGFAIWFLVKLYTSARLPYLAPEGEPAGG